MFLWLRILQVLATTFDHKSLSFAAIPYFINSPTFHLPLLMFLWLRGMEILSQIFDLKLLSFESISYSFNSYFNLPLLMFPWLRGKFLSNLISH